MRLPEWLKQVGKTEAEFARDLRVAPSTIYRLNTGARDASADLARKIYKATGGKVTANDLFKMKAA